MQPNKCNNLTVRETYKPRRLHLQHLDKILTHHINITTPLTKQLQCLFTSKMSEYIH